MERDAFISYSHKADVPLATALQKGLHDIVRTPWLRRPGLKVFRDTTSLGASHDLGSAITAALAGSRYFVYLASPEAAQSKWVRKEIAYWRRNHGLDHFLIALSSGTIAWDDTARDFDWTRTDALPEELSWAFTTEPLWVDLRAYRACDPAERSMAPGAGFRDRVATLAAPLHGLSKDALDSEDLRLQRKAVRVLRSGVAVLSATTLIAAGAGVFAWQQRNEAVSRARTSASQALAARALEAAQTDPRKAAQFALYADAVRRTGESAQALGRAVAANDNVGRHLQAGSEAVASYRGAGTIPPTKVAVSRDGNMLAYYSYFDSSDSSGSPDTSAAPDDTRLHIHLYDIRAGRTLPPLEGISWRTLDGGELEFSADGRLLAVETAINRLEIWDVVERKRLQALTASDSGNLSNAHMGLRAFAFSPDGQRVAASFYATPSADDYHLTVWDAATGRVIHDMKASPDRIGLAFDKDNRLHVLDTGNRTLRSLARDSESWGAPRELRRLPENLQYPSLSNDATKVSFPEILNVQKAEVWDLVKEERVDAEQWALFPSGGGPIFAAKQKEVAVYDEATRSRRVLASFSWPVLSQSASADGRWVAAGSEDGAVSLFSTLSMQGGTPVPNEHGVKGSELTPDKRFAFRDEADGTGLWAVTGAGVKRLGRIPVRLGRTVNFSDTDSVIASSDGTRAVAVQGEKLSLWNPASGKEMRPPLEAGEHLLPLSFLPDDIHIVAAGEDGLKVIDTQSWEVRQSIPGDAGVGSSVIEPIVSADRTTVALMDDGGLSVWRWSEDQRLSVVRKAAVAGSMSYDIALSGHGDRAAVINMDDRITMVDVRTGHTATSTGVQSRGNRRMAFSQDGTFVIQAVGSGKNISLQFWDAVSGEARGTWSLQDQTSDTPVPELLSAADGSVLAFAADGTLVRRATDLASWRKVLCDLAPDPLPQNEYDRYLKGIDIPAPCRRRDS
ncbi:TIR domain-containing protein [Streptomyces bambusae]|uniref:TIR domain-containing protein n=1 Tax=Streptomyces bambusae TaxID=1550616 RepID=A0ABS6Z5A9_9ACTN|nr:TIR domain-containing protein [Streptomyces bambusae]MBW5482917.1 TIR domain-containing protein [Streptomyces bambusae]